MHQLLLVIVLCGGCCRYCCYLVVVVMGVYCGLAASSKQFAAPKCAPCNLARHERINLNKKRSFDWCDLLLSSECIEVLIVVLIKQLAPTLLTHYNANEVVAWRGSRVRATLHYKTAPTLG